MKLNKKHGNASTDDVCVAFSHWNKRKKKKRNKDLKTVSLKNLEHEIMANSYETKQFIDHKI